MNGWVVGMGDREGEVRKIYIGGERVRENTTESEKCQKKSETYKVKIGRDMLETPIQSAETIRARKSKEIAHKITAANTHS